jgi:hypothetical protein
VTNTHPKSTDERLKDTFVINSELLQAKEPNTLQLGKKINKLRKLVETYINAFSPSDIMIFSHIFSSTGLYMGRVIVGVVFEVLIPKYN